MGVPKSMFNWIPVTSTSTRAPAKAPPLITVTLFPVTETSASASISSFPINVVKAIPVGIISAFPVTITLGAVNVLGLSVAKGASPKAVKVSCSNI
jgi:hypothetical protein